MTHGARSLAALNKSRTRRAPCPTKTSSNFNVRVGIIEQAKMKAALLLGISTNLLHQPNHNGKVNFNRRFSVAKYGKTASIVESKNGETGSIVQNGTNGKTESIVDRQSSSDTSDSQSDSQSDSEDME